MDPTAADQPLRPPDPSEHGASAATLLVAAGRAGQVADAPLDRLAGILGERGPVRTVDPTTSADLDGALGQVPHDQIVVAGGDGTLHEVLAALTRRAALAATPVGLVPLGTANDFARGVGLPLDPLDAAVVARDGRLQRMDLLVDDAGRDEIVVNVVHLGIGARAAAAAAPLKPLVGAVAYPVGAVLGGVTAETWELQVEVDGVAVVGGQPVVFVGVCNGSTIGGGTPVCPVADPTDGLVDVVAVTAPHGVVDMAELVTASRRGTLLEEPGVRHHRGQRVRVTGQSVGAVADGEIRDDRPEHRFRLLAGAWRLRLP